MSAHAIDNATDEISLEPVAAEKSIPIAVLLSLVFPGLGHFYAGKIVPGVAFMIMCVLTFGLMGRITSSVNAAMTVKRYNASLAA